MASNDLDSSCIQPIKLKSSLLNELALDMLPDLPKKLENTPDDKKYWHRFMVSCDDFSLEKYSRNFILKSITDSVCPTDLLPVYYKMNEGKAFFLARNCMKAIAKICEARFLIQNQEDPNHPFKLTIIRDIATITDFPVIDAEANIEKVLKKRFDGESLSLNKFHEDEDLAEFCPLNQPKLLKYILILAEKLKPKNIDLSHNDIKIFPTVGHLINCKLNSIDLSNNQIEELSSLNAIIEFRSLRKLHLIENPLCGKFDDELAYFSSIKKDVCKNLEVLDNKTFRKNSLPVVHRTFLCDSEGENLTNSFLEYYFTLYDEDRRSLQYVYDDNALFSVGYRILRNRDLSTSFKNAIHFQLMRRNLLDKLSNSNKKIYLGKETILRTFNAFPRTKHNPYSFLVDLILYTQNYAVISVSGLFKEVPVNKNLLYAFSRNFVLKRKSEDRWVIINELLHIYHPLPEYVYDIPFPTHNVNNAVDIFPSSITEVNKTDILKSFQNITNLTPQFSDKYMRRAGHNLELALRVFVEDHSAGNIPTKAFSRSSREGQKQKDIRIRTTIIEEFLAQEFTNRLIVSKCGNNEEINPQLQNLPSKPTLQSLNTENAGLTMKNEKVTIGEADTTTPTSMNKKRKRNRNRNKTAT